MAVVTYPGVPLAGWQHPDSSPCPQRPGPSIKKNYFNTGTNNSNTVAACKLIGTSTYRTGTDTF